LNVKYCLHVIAISVYFVKFWGLAKLDLNMEPASEVRVYTYLSEPVNFTMRLAAGY